MLDTGNPSLDLANHNDVVHIVPFLCVLLPIVGIGTLTLDFSSFTMLDTGNPSLNLANHNVAP